MFISRFNSSTCNTLFLYISEPLHHAVLAIFEIAGEPTSSTFPSGKLLLSNEFAERVTLSPIITGEVTLAPVHIAKYYQFAFHWQ